MPCFPSNGNTATRLTAAGDIFWHLSRAEWHGLFIVILWRWCVGQGGRRVRCALVQKMWQTMTYSICLPHHISSHLTSAFQWALTISQSYVALFHHSASYPNNKWYVTAASNQKPNPHATWMTVEKYIRYWPSRTTANNGTQTHWHTQWKIWLLEDCTVLITDRIYGDLGEGDVTLR